MNVLVYIHIKNRYTNHQIYKALSTLTLIYVQSIQEGKNGYIDNKINTVCSQF